MNRPEHRRFERASKLIGRLSEFAPSDLSAAFVVEAPLRICPLGAHTDHQGGLVTGMTVDRHVVLAAVASSDTEVKVHSLDFPGETSFDLGNGIPKKCGDWGDYLRGAVAVLGAHHPLRVGLRAVVGGDLPGSGLSSSAAVLIAYLFALARVNGIEISREETSALVQMAENSYIGVASGRLDQSIILFAEQDYLTRVDCADLSIEQIPRPRDFGEFGVLVAYSGVRRALVGSGFNSRVDECREAARLLLELDGEVALDNPVLSNVEPAVFERFGADLPQAPRRRAAHYFGEQRRVRLGVDAWRGGDLDRFGGLMTASGASSIHNFECGTAELNTLYEALRDAPGVYGTRFSGGGFGGSCIALIQSDAGDSVIERVMRRYEAVHPQAAAEASYHLCRPGGAARVLDLEV